MLERVIRGMGGGLVLVSLLLAVYVNIHWLWFTAFVGANLFQSAFTNWCPAMTILRKLGVPSGGGACCRGENHPH